MDMVSRAVLMGIGATAAMDIWALLLSWSFGVPLPSYAMVGRWLGHMPSGRFVHASIGAAPRIRGEGAFGWLAHYATGIAFAGLLLVVWGADWARQPTPGPALLVGILTVAAPFPLMQPGMGLGMAASRTPRPNVARLRSIANHAVFGAGLYIAAWTQARLLPFLLPN